MFTIAYQEKSFAIKEKSRNPLLPKLFGEVAPTLEFLRSFTDGTPLLKKVRHERWSPLKIECDMCRSHGILTSRKTRALNSLYFFKACCCFSGGKQVAFFEIDPETLYALVVCHETTIMLREKVVTEDLILYRIDFPLHTCRGNWKPCYNEKPPADSSGIPVKTSSLFSLSTYMEIERLGTCGVI